jgi:hypothetical protein
MFGQVPGSYKHARYWSSSNASFNQLIEIIYGKPMADSDDVKASRENYKTAYGISAMGYGLARMVVDGAVPFSDGDRAEIRRFVEGVVGAFVRAELAAPPATAPDI